MSKKIADTLANFENIYWKAGTLAHPDCQYRINCNSQITELAFKKMLVDFAEDGTLYTFDTPKRQFVLAFKDKAMRDVHAALFELKAKAAGANLEAKQNNKVLYKFGKP